MRQSSSVNLVRGRNVNFFDSFLNWALTAGRVVVIATETVALTAFLYRFSLDRQLIDIHSKIKQEQTVVSYLKTNEDIYRNLQARLSLATNFGQQGSSEVKILTDVVSFANGLTFNSITLQEDRIKINANATNVSSLSEFVKKLRVYPKISSVIIDKIENRTSQSIIIVSFTALLRE